MNDEAPFFAVVLDVLGQFCDVSFIIVQTHCGLLLSVGTSLFRLKKASWSKDFFYLKTQHFQQLTTEWTTDDEGPAEVLDDAAAPPMPEEL